jgi:hypothetical protein
MLSAFVVGFPRLVTFIIFTEKGEKNYVRNCYKTKRTIYKN